MPLGVDNAQQLNGPGINWAAFTAFWGGKTPAFAGRYFGNTGFPWTPGEITGLSNNISATLKYILPFSGTGLAATKPNLNPPPARIWIPDPVYGLPQFYAEMGLDANLNPQSDLTIFEQGEQDAHLVCMGIEAAVNHFDNNGKRELDLPANGNPVYVFLDVEDWTPLHIEYWSGWAREVYHYNLAYQEGSGPGDLIHLRQCLLPCVYGYFSNNASGLRITINNALTGKNPDIWSDRCYGFVGLNPFNNTPEDMTETDLAAAWNFPDYDQPGWPFARHVLVWQYGLNCNYPGSPLDSNGNPVGMDLLFCDRPGAVETALDHMLVVV